MQTIKYIYDSLKWIKRDQNKDDILIISNNNTLLFVLFDWVSSSISAKKWIKFIKSFIWKNMNSYIIDGEIKLKDLIFDSNAALLKSNIIDSYSTCSAFSFSEQKQEYKFINIWDSRIYWIFMNYKKQFSSDDNEKYNKNILTKYIWRSLDYKSFEEISLQKDEIWKWNILICSDGFYNILEKNKLLFHEILHYKRLWNIRNRLNKELYKKNIDDASYIYILTNTDV